jgi:hypothetical protein
MTPLTERDLSEVLERTVPERAPGPQLAGRARLQAQTLRRRRRMVIAAAVVGVLAIGAPVTVTAMFDGWGNEPSGIPATATGDVDRCADDACDPTTVVAAIRRPLRLGVVPNGEACPVSPARQFPAGAGFSDPFSAVGSGPLYLAGSDDDPATVTMSASRGRWLEQKVIWVVDDSYSGALLLRGRRLDGAGELRFTHYLGAVGYAGGAGDGKRHPELAYVRSGLNAEADSALTSYPSGIHVTSPGCYGIQVDGVGFSDTLIFRATVPG